MKEITPLSRRVPGIGKMPCRVMVISDYPGRDECERGYPLAGKTGREFNRWCNGYELPLREEMYITNLLKHQPIKKVVSEAEIARDEDELIAEILATQPEFIIGMGRYILRWLMGDVNVEKVHGIPHTLTIRKAGYQTHILPCFNPAAGFRDTETAGKVAYDFQQASLALRGRLSLRSPVDQFTSPFYREGFKVAAGNKDRFGLTPSYSPLQPTYKWAATDTENAGTKHDSPPWGLSISTRNGDAFVAKKAEDIAIAKAILEDDEILAVMHSALHDIPVYRKMGIKIKNFTDTMVKAYLLCLEPQGLKDLAYRLCGMEMKDYFSVLSEAEKRIAIDYLEGVEQRVARLQIPVKDLNKWMKTINRVKALPADEIRSKWDSSAVAERIDAHFKTSMPEATLDDIPEQEAITYSARDADATGRINLVLDQRIDAMGLRQILEVDLGAIPLIERMQYKGMKIDPAHFKKMSGDLVRAMAEIREEIDRIAGWPVNPQSGDQVAKLLFDQLHLPILKYTDSRKRPSTDDKVLEALEGIHPIIELVRDDREANKMFTAFTEKIGLYADHQDRIHPKYRVTRTATGRLAASEPNVLALPKHSTWGKLFRRGFIPDTGHRIGSWDLNQIELRVLAHCSGDAEMLRIYRAGRDIHAERAYQLFGVKPEDQDESLHRFPVKKVNFGIIMGMTEIGLAEQMRINKVPYDEADCAKFISDTFNTWPGAKAWMEEKKNEARRFGFVRDMGGRIRYLPGVHSPLRDIRSEAERQAHATPIQSGAQYIKKRWEAIIWDRLPDLWDEGIYVEPWCDIHDDVVLEYDDWSWPMVNEMMLGSLELVQGFKIPITCKGVNGPNWGTLGNCGTCKKHLEFCTCEKKAA